MRIDRYTQKMQEALQEAANAAAQANHSEVSNEHLLAALLAQPEGIVRPLLEKLGASPQNLEDALRLELERRAHVHGGHAQPGIGRELTTVLNHAEEEMRG